jgi:mono/diheme cytochrome c family protein
MRNRTFTNNKTLLLIATGLLVTLIAASCAQSPLQVTTIPVPTAALPQQTSAASTATTASSIQVLPTQTGQAQAVATVTPSSPAPLVSFAKDVLPIFQANCTGCHGSNRQAAGLDFSSYASLMNGAPVIVPNDPNNSQLLQAVIQGFMPRGGNPLSAQDIQTITDWINAGAPNN